MSIAALSKFVWLVAQSDILARVSLFGVLLAWYFPLPIGSGRDELDIVLTD